jgi:protein tyrosine/serine phosphatase
MKRRTLYLIAGLLLLIAPIGWQSYTGNFHTVAPGEVYRSAQLSPEQLASRIDELGIRSVLNLRGEDAGKEWYDGEVATTTAKGVTHADFLMTSGTALDRRQSEQLVSLMSTLPKPMLIHCWGGADRTGLASALYLYGVKQRSADEAAEQLSWRYGHVPYLFWSKTRAMDDTFNSYVNSLDR